MKKVNLGLIGCGRIAQRGHLPSIKAIPEAVLSSVCDINEETAKKVAGRFNVPYTTDASELVRRKDVDAVIVAVPHKYHKENTVDALNQKKHVLCEKPLAMTLEEADEMVQAAEENQVTLMTAENYLYDPGIQLMVKFIEDGLLGKIELVNLEQVYHMVEPGWRRSKEIAGGGILMDDGVHHTAVALAFAGAAKSLYASVDTYHPVIEGERIDVDDNAFIMMEHENGALSTIYSSGINRFPRFRFEVHGNKGSALYQWVIGSPWNQYKPEMKISGFEYELPRFPSWLPSAESYRNEMETFLDCVRQSKKPLTDGRFGRAALLLVLKAYESASRKEKLTL